MADACRVCLVPLTKFNRVGICTRNPECLVAYHAAYRELHKDERATYMVGYYEEHKEHQSTRMAAWYQETKEARAVYGAAWYRGLHRGARGRTRRRHLGFYLRDLSQPPSCGRPDSGQFYALDLRCLAHNFLSEDGLFFPARLCFLLLRRHDGPATHLGEDDGSRDEGRPLGANPKAIGD